MLYFAFECMLPLWLPPVDALPLSSPAGHLCSDAAPCSLTSCVLHQTHTCTKILHKLLFLSLKTRGPILEISWIYKKYQAGHDLLKCTVVSIVSEADLCRKCPEGFLLTCWASLELCSLFSTCPSSSAASQSVWQLSGAWKTMSSWFNSFQPSSGKKTSCPPPARQVRVMFMNPAPGDDCDSFLIVSQRRHTQKSSPARLSVPAGRPPPSVTLGSESAVWRCSPAFGKPAPGSTAQDSGPTCPPLRAPAQSIEQDSVMMYMYIDDLSFCEQTFVVIRRLRFSYVATMELIFEVKQQFDKFHIFMITFVFPSCLTQNHNQAKSKFCPILCVYAASASVVTRFDHLDLPILAGCCISQ